MTFEPASQPSFESRQNLYLLHGTLPREVVCTENLTPFLKLLPCKGKAGIASLLDGHKLFDAEWQSMAIDVRSVCPGDDSECSIEMEQTVDMVLDVERSKRPRGRSFVRSTIDGVLTVQQTTQFLDRDPARVSNATFPSHMLPTKPATPLMSHLDNHGPLLRSSEGLFKALVWLRTLQGILETQLNLQSPANVRSTSTRASRQNMNPHLEHTEA